MVHCPVKQLILGRKKCFNLETGLVIKNCHFDGLPTSRVAFALDRRPHSFLEGGNTPEVRKTSLLWPRKFLLACCGGLLTQHSGTENQESFITSMRLVTVPGAPNLAFAGQLLLEERPNTFKNWNEPPAPAEWGLRVRFWVPRFVFREAGNSGPEAEFVCVNVQNQRSQGECTNRERREGRRE